MALKMMSAGAQLRKRSPFLQSLQGSQDDLLPGRGWGWGPPTYWSPFGQWGLAALTNFSPDQAAPFPPPLSTFSDAGHRSLASLSRDLSSFDLSATRMVRWRQEERRSPIPAGTRVRDNSGIPERPGAASSTFSKVTPSETEPGPRGPTPHGTAQLAPWDPGRALPFYWFTKL